MTALKNHPSMWLNDQAAAAFNAAEDKYGIFNVQRAGVTVADQQKLIDRWNAGGVYNRPPYLFQPKSPAPTSTHVMNGGEAVDLGDWQRFRNVCGEFGFEWYGTTDVVHFTFIGWNGGTPIPFSQDVQNEQNWMRVARGEQIQADGKLGPLTIAAIKRYQTFLRDWGYGYTGLIDGNWGPATQAAHARYYAAYNTPRANTARGATGQYVKDIQWRLNVSGAHLTVDGVFGPSTDAAVRTFQRAHNLTADGIVGIQTRRVLGL